MQWIAIVSMLIDHIGAVWFPDAPVWRLIGRLAFPIYAYYVTVGMTRTRDRRKYVVRLAWLAAVSQLPFMVLFNTWTINVIGTFLVSAFAIYRMEEAADPIIKWLWIAGAGLFMSFVPFDYGAYGLVLLLLYRYADGEWMWIGHLVLNGFFLLLNSVPVQVWSVLPTFLFAFTLQRAPARRADLKAAVIRYSAPRWLWRAFYPAHLTVLMIAALITGEYSP